MNTPNDRWVAFALDGAEAGVPHPFRYAGPIHRARAFIADLFTPSARLVVVPLDEWFEVAAGEVEDMRAGAVRASWAMESAP